MKYSVTFHIMPAMVMFCILSGCRSVPPSDFTLKTSALDPVYSQVPLLDPQDTNTVSVKEAILHALRSDADINELAARCHRAAGDLIGLKPESPEIRLGYERSHDDRRGWALGEEVGNRIQTGEQRTSGSGTQTSIDRDLTSRTSPGALINPTQTTVEDSITRESSRSSEYETFRSESFSSRNSADLDFQRQKEDGISVALRVRPPNPWLLSAEKQAGKSVQTIAEAELLVREQQLACDIVEASLRLHYQQSMLRLQTSFVARVAPVHDRVRKAFEKGSLTSEDYADGCRLMSAALAKQHRLESEVADLESSLRQLAGVDPSRLDLAALRKAAIIPGSVPKNQADDNTWASSLLASHALVLRAQWTLHLMESEWKKSQAAGIPWASRLIAGYSWWDGTRYGYRTYERSGFETQTTTSQSTRNETEISNTQGTEYEAPSGDVTDHTGTGQQSSKARRESTETQQETSNNSGSESSNARDDGDEWWVEVGVEIPIFEWLSGESRVRKQAAKAAREAFERVQQRVYSYILSALNSTRRTSDALQQSLLRFQSEYASMNQFVSTAKRQGLLGEIRALRVNEELIEMALLSLDCSLREALARIELVRVAGLSPALDPPSDPQNPPEDKKDKTE